MPDFKDAHPCYFWFSVSFFFICMRSVRNLAFRNKPLEAESMLTDLHADATQAKPAKQRRQVPQSAEMVLDAPELIDDYYLNLLDCGSSNVLSIALGSTVYLWDASSQTPSELVTTDEDSGPVTSVSWAPDGQHIAIGLNSSDVQLLGFHLKSTAEDTARGA